jgi:RimJ/RimL family protein N-acetyltransferase
LIEGERIYLRAIEPEDEETCWRWMNDADAIHYLTMPPWPVSRVFEREWVQRRSKGGNEDDRVAAICLKADGRHIGNVGLHNIQWRHGTAVLGILIGEKDCWDQGYGEETVRLVLRFAFKSLGLRKIRLSVFAPNRRAQRCYEKCGFEVEGVLGRQHLLDGLYVDEILMAAFRPGEGENADR